MKRIKEIKVRFTDDELERLNSLVDASNVKSREEFVRLALIDAVIRERPPAEYGQIVRELRRIGSNIDQILVKARTLGFVDELMLVSASRDIRRMDAVFTDAFSN
jgi:metal-responsive CopG/Arc/MetJ family transcriptional regulator